MKGTKFWNSVKILNIALGLILGLLVVVTGFVYVNSEISKDVNKKLAIQAEARKAKAYLVTEVDGCKTYNVYGEFQRGDVVRNASTYFTVCEGSSVIKTGSGNKDEIHETMKGNKQ